MSFLSGIAGGLADKAEKDRAGKKKKGGKQTTTKQDMKDSPIGKLVSKLGSKLKTKGDKVPSYKKGGKVRKTGPAKLHKGEKVLTKRQADKQR